MLNFVILWEGRGFFRFFNFVKNAQFCHFVRGLLILSLLQFCQKWSILSFCERPVYFFRVFNYVKNTQFLQFCERTVDFFNSSILSKMLNFVIFREAPGFFFHFFNFVKNCPFCHLWKVDFKLWDKNKYTICTLCVVIYQTILSKRLNFVILWEDRGLFRFFNFVKNAPFCHFVRCPCIFSRLQFCQKCSTLSLCERTVDFYAYSILSKNAQFCHFVRGSWNVSILQFRQKRSILSFSERPVDFFTFSSLSKIVHFVICEKWTSNFNFVKNCPFCHLWKVDFKLWDKYKYTCVHYVLWYMKLFCQKGLILSLSERPV